MPLTDEKVIAGRLRRLADEMERYCGAPEMAPGPDAVDLIEAADAIERLLERGYPVAPDGTPDTDGAPGNPSVPQVVL